MSFRTRIFLSAMTGTAAALLVVTLLFSTVERERLSAAMREDLVSRAELAAAMLRGRPPAPSLDAEAGRLAAVARARVTFIDATGRVLGDSEVPQEALDALENHATRPEVVDALRTGRGTASRRSSTTGGDFLYAAAPVRNSPVAVVRLARPIESVRAALDSIWRTAAAGLAGGLLTALALSWLMSRWLAHRVRVIAGVARRYAGGDLSRPVRDYGDDEIGQVARVLDDSIQELGRRLGESARDRAHMEAILSGMFEGVVLVDGDGRLQMANAAARDMLQMPEAPEGRRYVEIIRQPDVAAMLGLALRGETSERLELTLNRDPGRTFAARTAPLAGGTRAGAVLVLHDITALRRADQIRRDFVANVSHELRTPLTAVRGYVEALLDAPADRETERRFLEIIARHTLRMERLVKDLLRLARLDAGQEELENTTLGIEPLLSAIQAELEPAMVARRITLAVDIAPDAAAVTGDPGKLYDALRNLIENAVHYGAEATPVDITARRDGGALVIEVSDRGPGIPPGDLQRIFERFYRVDRARARDPGGTGLGLAIVKHLIGLHGGTVHAANRAGGGATFAVRLPQPP